MSLGNAKSCTDSDDPYGGLDYHTYYEYGSVHDDTINFNDTCLNDRFLVEGYCFNDKFNAITVDCYPGICFNTSHTKFGRCENYQVRVIDCRDTCSDEESPNDICRYYGNNWFATSVECENIAISGGGDQDRTFDQNLDWCVNGGFEDLTVTCKTSNPVSDIKVKVIDCSGKGLPNDDCREIGKSPNEICSSFGSDYLAIDVDCETIGMKVSGNQTRYFDEVWTDDIGWCERRGEQDMTVTCERLSSKPNIAVRIIDCGDSMYSCLHVGSPNEICRSIGYDHAIAVDCENIEMFLRSLEGWKNWNRVFDQNLDWCKNDGIQDLTITCSNEPLMLDCKNGIGLDGLCHARCGADIECEDVTPGTGACSKDCYYVDINKDHAVNIIDIAKVAGRFGGITGSFIAQSKTSLPVIFLLMVIIFVFIILSVARIFRK